jgi:hypothetical protein
MVAHRASADYKFGSIRMKTKGSLNVEVAVILSTPRPRERQQP